MKLHRCLVEGNDARIKDDPMPKKRTVDRTTDPLTMTPQERMAEIASILALGLVRASSLLSTSPIVSESSPGGLEDRKHADLSVGNTNPQGGQA